MTEETSFHFAEYAKPIAKNGKNRRHRLLLICLYILVAGGYIGGAIAITIPHLIAMLPLLLWILIYFTWRAVSYECCVRVASGKIAFLRLQGKRESPLLSLETKDILFARSFDKEDIRDKSVKLYDFRADEKEPGYLLLFENASEKAFVRFECTVAIATAMRYYNKNVVVDKNTLKL